jgi:hypothetical protein
MIIDEEIDLALLANVTNQWRKVAFVVGMTMMEIDSKRRVGRDDLYFAKRIAVLVRRGLIEHTGDLNRMRYCEVRLSSHSDAGTN